MTLDKLLEHLFELREQLGDAAGETEVHIFFDPDPGLSNPERYWYSAIDDVTCEYGGTEESPSDIRIHLVEGSGV